MTWVKFFQLFKGRELTNQVFLCIYDARFDRIYRAVLRAGLRAAPVWLSLLQCIGYLTSERRAEIEKEMRAK